MNIKILEKKEVPLLSRTEIKAQLIFNRATPSTSEVTKSLAKDLSVDEKTIVIRKISTKFGFSEAKAIAHIYKKEEDMKIIEPAHFFKTEASKKEKSTESPIEKEETTKEILTEESKAEEIKSEEKSA